MSSKVAIVFCAHHKPWLMMSTLLTTLMQDREDTDLHVVYNLGDGTSDRPSYREYQRVAAAAGVNPQLSAFDERVRNVCRLRRDRVFEHEYENDHALDSGVWYKFIRDGRWRHYERVLFLGEGALLAHPRALDALIEFSARHDAHFIASGHEKRRVPRRRLEQWADGTSSPLDRLHGEMIAETFRIFGRDPAFRAVYDRWGSDFPVETRHDVPSVAFNGPRVQRVRHRIQREWGSPYSDAGVSPIGRAVRRLPCLFDEWASRASIWAPRAASHGDGREVRFHREPGPEWFGCTVLHLFSRTFLERLSAKLEQFRLYDALELPFAGTPLEIIWGLLPAWLGFEKWFTNGLHRIRKQFTTYQREDYPPEMAGYINRYHRGRVAVGWQGDFLKVKAWRPELSNLRQMLPAVYF